MKRPGSTNASVSFSSADLEQAVPERFEKIVRMYPDRLAVKTGNEAVTYSQLNAMANRLAHAIVARRGSEAEAIAILVEKGPHLMAAMLAVLKAGKFFVLLDSSFPKARNLALLEDSQAGLVIVDRGNATLSRDMTTKPARLLELGSMESSSIPDHFDPCVISQAFATIVYTSGSTGDPKGVIFTHQDLLHRIMLRTIENQARADDRIALLPIGTANTVTNIFFALLNGAMLCPFAVQKEGVIRLAKWLSDEGITICPFSSSLFRSFTAVLTGQEKFPELRIVRLRSETVHKSDFELFKKHFPDHCAFVTGLSSSETGQLTTYFLNHKSDIPDVGVPIGYPVQDKEILLVDDAGNDVGLNQIGEIVVRSRYLSVGYWRRPELTASKFSAEPNGSKQRLCYTGDLGLRLPDGCLVHKGRKDFRVKIRGYGVELAEVERRIFEHGGVKQAVVVARQTDSGDARLVAYYTGAGNPPPRSKGLRDFLEKKLPQYMIPATFTLLDAMPLTPNGKIDRRALPGRDNLRPDLVTAYQPPRNETEQKLVSIWEDVLDVRHVGINDGFFDLGGDSLSATRVISQVIDHFQLEIPLQLLLQSPTIADMAAVVARRQGKLSGNNKAIDTATASSVHTFADGFLPLSYSQQRLWFLDQLDPGSFTYNLFSAYRLKGELNVAALEQSFNEILRRHEILRTVFKSEGGNPVQVVLPSLTIKIPIFDPRATVSEQDRWTEARRMFTEEAQRPFNLATGPLLRITLLQLAADEYVLLRAMHHIVSDGWSEGVLFRELSEIYEALSTGQPFPLPDLPTQYADYAKWQRQWFKGERLESQLSYWKEQLDNIETLQLPTDRPWQASQGRRGARRYFAFSDALTSELKELSNQHGVTLFMTLLAVFQTLLHRYSGQNDIAIGSPVAGRNCKKFEELIGFFLNTLVLRLDLSGNPTFVEAIRRVREVCLGALSHQELPFEKLVEEIHPDRTLGQNPLFQVSFAFQNTSRVLPRLSGITVEEVEVTTGIARFDLHLFMEELEGCLKGYCDYDTNLFNADTIERMIGHLKTLLRGIVENPDQRLSDLPLLTEVEKHQLLVEWNNTKTDYSKDKCIAQLFEEAAERNPDAVAVICEGDQLSYRELNGRANQLAHCLRSSGVGAETLVAVCLERSIKMIVGLLAILKAGGAYVPLDPAYPRDRISFILRDTQASVLLTDAGLIGDVIGDLSEDVELGSQQASPQGRPLKVICLDRERKAIGNESAENIAEPVAAENLAYVIYTSGSTGFPKGVMIERRSAAAFLDWAHGVFTKEDLAGVVASTSICFDLSVFEIFAPLTAGGSVILVENALALPHLDSAVAPTLVNTVPSVMNELLRLGGLPRSIRTVNLAGEPLKTSLVQQIYQNTSAGQICDLYGPSETTTYSTYTRRSTDGVQTIGRPIANTQVYILDPHGNPTPVGVPGEIYIGGAGVARGYLNHPELTAEKFIAHPFSAESGARLYRTGDIARYLPDGNIEFLGRMDNQVKIRGYRIELGEIEAVLNRHPKVRDTVVIAREDSPGDKRLAAYVVGKGDEQPQADELKRFLKATLPDYMVPSAWVVLASLPHTPNGKINRAALPAPEAGQFDSTAKFTVPRTEVEKTLARVWAEVLKLERVGVHDNFFDLGGHSLLATQIVSRLQNTFNIDISLRTLFESPTIEQMAAVIMENQEKQLGEEELKYMRAELESLPDEGAQLLFAGETVSTTEAKRHE